MLKLKDITVLKQIYDPHADGYLVTGKLKDPTADKPYVLGFRKRHGRNILDQETFSSKGWLTRTFNSTLRNDEWSDEPTFQNDTHAKPLYAWENKYLEPYAPRVSEKKARLIIRKVCNDYDIEPTILRWRPDNDGKSSLYDPADHAIEFHHRDLVSLLHEIGHAIHFQDDKHAKGAHHAPAFTRILLELYNRYAGFPIDYLVITANQFKLLGDMKNEQLIFTPPKHPRV